MRLSCFGKNTDVVRDRYLALWGGNFALTVKEGCDHHPHSLANPKQIVDFMPANYTAGEEAEKAFQTAPKPGSIIRLAPSEW